MLIEIEAIDYETISKCAIISNNSKPTDKGEENEKNESNEGNWFISLLENDLVKQSEFKIKEIDNKQLFQGHTKTYSPSSFNHNRNYDREYFNKFNKHPET
jgi:hypothetical protein